MHIFVITHNRLKNTKFKVENIEFYIDPIYYLEISHKNTAIAPFLNYILDSITNNIKIYTFLPRKYSYFVFKHPNIKEVEEDYAKESASLFNLKLTNFKKGWAIKTTFTKESKIESDTIKEFVYRNFANRLLDIFIPYEKFNINRITKPLFHKINLPSVNKDVDLENFYNFTKDELQIIFEDYKKHFGRNPNIIELGTFAQYWSEHCRHKTINGTFYIDGKLYFKNLLKETIFKATKKLNKKWCVSVFKDNSGIIEVDNNICICAKVETHNHPSSIEPYSGSSTGIGGVIRDIIGTGKGAKPIASIDAFFVGDITSRSNNSIWHPYNLLKNLVLGVKDYGNRMGIPTTAGLVYFDDSYTFNPLVYCGTIGIINKNNTTKECMPGDYIILVGGKTGRDGLHGASFSSGKISEEQIQNAIHSVQTPNPIAEKRIEQFVVRATEEKIIKSITDCGAGGISVAVLEIVQKYGARISLDDVKTKYKGLSSYELWISESQERMIILVDKRNLKKFDELACEEGMEYSILGTVTEKPVCTILHKGKIIAQFNKNTLDMKLPSKVFHLNSFKIISATPVDLLSHFKNTNLERLSYLKKSILSIIADPIVCSKESIIRQYDHEVGGRTVIKPIIANFSPSNGSVIRVTYNKTKGVAIGLGHKVSLMAIDSYEGALQSIDEAVKNTITMGANPRKIALLDNFCWGNSYDREQLYKLVESAKACRDCSLLYNTPFISGKDSFNNFFVDTTGMRINITPTLLITAVGIVDNIEAIPSTVLLSNQSTIYFVGSNQFSLGGSLFYRKKGYRGKFYPKLEPNYAIKLYHTIYTAIKNKLLKSIHDVSDGGLITTIIEMFLDSNYGVELNLKTLPCPIQCHSTFNINQNHKNNKFSVHNRIAEYDYFNRLIEVLFSEPPSSFIIEVENKHIANFEEQFKNFFHFKLGTTTNDSNLTLATLQKNIYLSKTVLKKFYTRTLKNLFP